MLLKFESAEELKEVINDVLDGHTELTGNYIEAAKKDVAEDLINKLVTKQATDVEEVRHGYWKQNPYCKRIYFCSECGRHIEDGSNKPLESFPYCHCGAKMDRKPLN